jgi:two-component system NarL family sensor kinase
LLATFSLHAALAIENARLFKRSRKAAILEERNRLAREIHDNLAQGLTALVLQLEVIDRLLVKDPTRITAELEQAKIQARSNLQEARRSVWDLRAGSDEMVSLADSIKREVGKLRVVTEMQFNFELKGSPVDLAWEATSHIFRIFLESINNILQHAHAKTAWIKLDFQAEYLNLQIKDDGVGLQSLEGKYVETKKGFGLTGMQERSRLLKGALNIISSMGAGTTVILEVPLKPWLKIVAKRDDK